MIAGLKTHARLAALVAVVILVAVTVIAVPQWIQGEEPMAIPTATRTAAIPGIGGQTPGVTETATFAMG